MIRESNIPGIKPESEMHISADIVIAEGDKAIGKAAIQPD
jgi:hypothetical protein